MEAVKDVVFVGGIALMLMLVWVFAHACDKLEERQ